jgi:hypothetical protein
VSITTFVPAQRFVVGSAASMTWQPTNSEGDAADPGLAVTVGVVRSNGDEVIAPGTATTGTTTAPRAIVIPLSELTQLDILTATWAVGGVDVATTTAEVVGGVYASVSAIKALESAITASDAAVKVARAEVEQMFEDACNRAFVPRFRVDLLQSSGTFRLFVRRPEVRRVAWVEEIDWQGVAKPIPVNEVEVGTDGVLRRLGSLPWPDSSARVRVAYEYGLDRPPADLVRLMVQVVRARLNLFSSGLPDRAVQFSPIEGGSVTLATPGVGGWITGMPEVDEALKRYRWTDAGIA